MRDLAGAVLIVRIGMASNALSAQVNAAHDASGRADRSEAVKNRDLITSFATTCALTFEATRLAQENMPALRALAAAAPAQLLVEIGQLCGGKHAASELLNRARNQLGFHWDVDVIANSVVEYGKNERLVWIESDDHEVMSSLAFQVLNRALFPDADTPDEVKAREVVERGMAQMADAVRVLVEFFNYSVSGYLKQIGATQRRRSIGDG